MTKRKSTEDNKYPEMDCFMNEELSDVVFVVNGHRIPALKGLLFAKSRVFRAMFSGNFKESKEKEIEIKDTTYEAFKTLIRFLYSEQLVLKDNNDFELIREVYKLCDRYEVLRLSDKIIELLKNKINSENLLPILKIWNEFEIKELKTKWCDFLAKNFHELVIKSNEYKLFEINDITENLILRCLLSEYRVLSHR